MGFERSTFGGRLGNSCVAIVAIPWEIQLFTSGRADYYGNVPERNSAAISRFHSVGGSSSLL